MIWKLFLLNAALAFAEERGAVAEHAAEGHHELVVPWMSLWVQFFNCAVLFLFLFFILRKTVKAHFAQRAATYRELVDRAENARREAERNRSEVQAKLAKLEQSAAQTATQAKSEAEQLRTKLMDEAKQLTRKMEQETQRTAQIELDKAKNALRAELLGKAISATEEKFKKGLGSGDQKQLQNEFAEKIEVVST